jgi:hypothetical protein
MFVIAIISFSIHLAVNGWLLLILVRNRIIRFLPWFGAYIASEAVGACVGLVLWSLRSHLYRTVFWVMAAAQIILIVGAVRESFSRLFVGFRSRPWFPWLVRSVIAMILLYSVWKAIYVPTVRTNRLISLIADGEFAFRWTILAVGLLAVILERIFMVSRSTREAAVLDGCTVVSLGVIAWVVSRSLLGQQYILVTQYFQEIGYLLGAAIWIKCMSRPPSPTGFTELSITPEQAAAELQRYRVAAKRILKRREMTDLAPQPGADKAD